MKKKLIGYLLVASLTCTALAACGKDNTTQTQETAVESGETAEEDVAEEETEAMKEELQEAEDEADAADEAAEGTEADITGDGPIHTEGSSDKWSVEDEGAAFAALAGQDFSQVNFFVLPGDSGYCTQGVYAKDETMSCFEAYKEDEDNGTLHFMMVAPSNLGQYVSLHDGYLLLMSSDDEYGFMGAPIVREDDWEKFGDYDSDEMKEIISSILGVPVGETYYLQTSDDKSCKIILDLTVGENKGYGCFIDDYESGVLNTFFVNFYGAPATEEMEAQAQEMLQSLTISEDVMNPAIMSLMVE